MVSGPGLAPAGDSLSFASPKESKQRKGDPTVCVPPLRYGQPAVLDYGGGPQNSLRSNSCGTDPASICAPRRIQRGLETERAFASLGHQATAALRAVVVGIGLGCWYWLLVLGPSEAKAARSHPFCMRRGAQMEAGSGPQLFEPKASSADPRRNRAPQVARSEAEGRRQ